MFVIIVMHGRSRIIIDPRIPTIIIPGRSTSGFHRPGGFALHEARSAGRGGVLGIRHGRSRMAIDPRIPTKPERSTSGFPRPGGTACTKRESP